MLTKQCRALKAFRSSHPELLLGKGILKIYSKFIGANPCRSGISIKLQSNFIEIALRHGCSPVNLLHIFRTAFTKNNSGWLLLSFPKITLVHRKIFIKKTAVCCEILQKSFNENCLNKDIMVTLKVKNVTLVHKCF